MAGEAAYDVMVIGGGGAGMTAAIAAADAGASVCLLEASAKTGGSTALAGGAFYAGGTAQQRALGIADSPDAVFEELVLRYGPRVANPLTRRICDDAPPTLAWLTSLGVQYTPEGLISANGRVVPRSHMPVGMGAGLVEVLDATLSRKPVDLAYRSRVRNLIRDASGRVAGAIVDGAEIRAHAVILTTGGYGASPELVERFLPKTRQIHERVWYTGHADNRGDGITMSEQLGAAIEGTDSALLLTSPGFLKLFEVFVAYWGLLVNENGERVVQEDGGYWEVAEALESQPHSRGFFIFDQPLLEAARPHPLVVATGTGPVSWDRAELETQIKKGRIAQADTLAALAERIGLPSEALEHTVAAYNQACSARRDTVFGKLPENLHAIQTAPFYAAEATPSVLVVTGGGPAVDADARVLDRSGSPIPGLYAAGETVGNVYGPSYVGTGWAIASAITMARIAGRLAAADARGAG